MRTIPQKENLIVEFKSDKKKLSDSDLIDAVLGMTNTDGGDLFLGVEDDGTVTGVHRDHEDATGVVALIANKTVPPVAVRAEIIKENSAAVLHIEIPMSKAIVAARDGKILRRRLKIDGTPENIPMYPYELNTRLSELSLLDFSAQPLSGAVMEDLNPNERVRLRRIIQFRKGDKELLDLSDEELDKALRLVREEQGELVPTVTGLLLIGKEDRIKELMPTAKAAFQVLEGTQVRINEEYSKPLLEMFELFETLLKAWNPEREIAMGLVRMPVPEFSETAFREGLVNAFCHRDYSILQRVRVAIEDEGLTISSPGGFIEGVSLQNLLYVEPHGRNQVLADALKRIGLAERTGRGIDRIFEGSIMYGRPWPDYSESTERTVKLFVQRAKANVAFTQMISDVQNLMGRSLPINSLLILSMLEQERRLTIQQIVERMHIAESRVRSNVEQLIETGLIEATASGKNRAYILSASVYKENNNSIAYVRQTGIDAIKHEELVLKLAKELDGEISRKDVIELLNVSDPQAYRILKKLAEKGVLKLKNAGRNAKYVLVD